MHSFKLILISIDCDNSTINNYFYSVKNYDNCEIWLIVEQSIFHLLKNKLKTK